MKLFLVISTLYCLSLAAPIIEKTSTLARRSYDVSSYSTDLKRRKGPQTRQNLRIRRSSTTGEGDAIDASQIHFLIPITIGDQTFDAELDTGGYSPINIFLFLD